MVIKKRTCIFRNYDILEKVCLETDKYNWNINIYDLRNKGEVVMINIKNFTVGLCMLVSGFVVYVVKKKHSSKNRSIVMSVFIFGKTFDMFAY